MCKRKKQRFLRIQRKSPRNFRIAVLKKFRKISWKTSAVVYFALIFANYSTPPWTAAFKIIWESCRDGFLFYRCSCSKMLEQLFSKIPKSSMEKIRGGVLFSILANKALHDGQFPGNFLKYFKSAILKNTSGQLLLEGFLFYASSRPKVLKKLLWKI